MTRIVIERRSALLYAAVFAIVAALMICIISVLLMRSDTVAIGSLLSLFILLSIAISLTRYNKVMVIVDDEGLTLKGDVMLGPIPWDCISGASINRVVFDKIMTVYLINMPKLESIFGSDSLYQKVNVNKKTGVNHISIDLDLCKLRGINLEALIKARAGSHNVG